MSVEYFYQNKRVSKLLDDLTNGKFHKELQKQFPRSLQYVHLDFSIGDRDDDSFIQIAIDRNEIKTIHISDEENHNK